MVKNPPASETQETGVGSLAQEDSPEEEMATCSSILAWGIPWIKKAIIHGVSKSQTRLNNNKMSS